MPWRSWRVRDHKSRHVKGFAFHPDASITLFSQGFPSQQDEEERNARKEQRE
jgi:hypothetical protein